MLVTKTGFFVTLH